MIDKLTVIVRKLPYKLITLATNKIKSGELLNKLSLIVFSGLVSTVPSELVTK